MQIDSPAKLAPEINIFINVALSPAKILLNYCTCGRGTLKANYLEALDVRVASRSDELALSRMLELYQHDISDAWDQDLDDRGQYGYDLDKYWEDPKSKAFMFFRQWTARWICSGQRLGDFCYKSALDGAVLCSKEVPPSRKWGSGSPHRFRFAAREVGGRSDAAERQREEASGKKSFETTRAVIFRSTTLMMSGGAASLQWLRQHLGRR